MSRTLTMQDAFLADIIAHPDDDTPRFIYADWLQDNGQEERAEFIRVQCEIARISCELMSEEDCGNPGCPGCEERRVLRQRERELLLAHSERGDWLTGLPWDWIRSTDGGGNDIAATVAGERIQYVFRRGFVASVSCTLAAFQQHGHAIVRSQPVEEVRIPGKRPTGFPQTAAEKRYWRWFSGERFNAPDSDDPDELPGWLWSVYALQFHDWEHPTPEAAHAALSTALLSHARSVPVGKV